jgi:cytoskeletal protein CcmA (bactofilin family)
VFGRKDSIKEFEQMRQALKPAQRFANRTEGEETTTPETTEARISNVESPAVPTANVLVPPPADQRSSVVSVGSTWEGNLKIDGSVRLEGEVSGEVEARETVFVAETARVNAKVRAAQVIIAGSFQGEVNCTERLQIMPTGRVKAELTTKLLTVFEGAIIEGMVRMTSEPVPAAASTATDPYHRKLSDKPAVTPPTERAIAPTTTQTP